MESAEHTAPRASASKAPRRAAATATPQRIAAVVLAAVLFIAAWWWLDVPTLATLRAWSESTGAWFPVVFWLFYVLLTQFPIPRTVMTLSAGILFGTWAGIALSLTATTAAAVLSLCLVRGLLRDWIAPRLTHPAVERINRRLEQRGWLAVASLRMIAGVPFSIMNYAAALTRVRVLPFAIATFFGSAPTTALGVIFGDTLTGQANPWAVAALVALGVFGVGGLLLDATLPTRRMPQEVKA
ncbi:TVP38/TMEM64 family protein [Corynebacterium sp. p3-SID1056]|uniref:TVP38/TMEM64 family protein n=1 Tax=Corynebacterium sp. p3-SID1056 TaxID=2916092 RepID=UPI0021A963F4|nr:TVP38/TMEM64 family protein [Corynebacterium sp. p3-SID1056]MCT2338832.1 TVP38/TMEM64 family protein [Corynebacterium sp. p3-SID1056]